VICPESPQGLIPPSFAEFPAEQGACSPPPPSLFARNRKQHFLLPLYALSAFLCWCRYPLLLGDAAAMCLACHGCNELANDIGGSQALPRCGPEKGTAATTVRAVQGDGSRQRTRLSCQNAGEAQKFAPVPSSYGNPGLTFIRLVVIVDPSFATDSVRSANGFPGWRRPSLLSCL